MSFTNSLRQINDSMFTIEDDDFIYVCLLTIAAVILGYAFGAPFIKNKYHGNKRSEDHHDQKVDSTKG